MDRNGYVPFFFFTIPHYSLEESTIQKILDHFSKLAEDNIKTAYPFMEIICQHVFDTTLKKSLLDQCYGSNFVQQVANMADQSNRSVDPLSYLLLESKVKNDAIEEAKKASHKTWGWMMIDYHLFQFDKLSRIGTIEELSIQITADEINYDY